MSSNLRAAKDELAQSLVAGITECSRRLRTVDLPSGLTRERVGAMSLIDEHGPIPVSELARLTNVRVPTISRMISSLVEEGLARKAGQKSDGRGVVISLTAKGRRALESANRKSIEHLRQSLDQLSPGQVAALSELARLLAADERS